MVGTQSLLAAAGTLEVVLIGVGILIVLVIVLVFFRYFNLWLQCIFSNAGISLMNLIGMSLRKINPSIIVRSKIAAVQAGVGATTRDMEAHYLAGGNVVNVIRSMIAADRANIPLDFRRAAGIDLAGRNVLEAVQTCVNPKVIDVPDAASGKETVSAVAKDGIQLLAKARVTVRTNIDRLIGGATEETIIARVGEGIVTSVGSAESHKNVLENPDLISRAVMDRGLDAGTAFEILSIDIADVDVGLNIGAKLQADQAEADKRVAQAKAEERAAMARAREQEMQALIAENRAKVVLAEAEIPKAMAAAFRDGNFGVMDYYNLRNVQADTKMRKSIAGEEGTEEENK
ncbi:MAG: flotillin-like protein FloA [Planctomycetota bacterium]|nr:flotillin-like protein FloA [Planctomycetota bacterium]